MDAHDVAPVGESEQNSYEAWFKARVAKGLHDISQGNVLSHEAVQVRASDRRRGLLERGEQRKG